MAYRTISALAFTLIVAVELVFYLITPSPFTTKQAINPKNMPILGIDYEQENYINKKYGTIIFATVIMGGIVTFSMATMKN